MPTTQQGQLPILIIGSSIAGPMTAICLKRAGIESVVYEAYPEPDDDVGLFIGLAPNGQQVLRDMDMASGILPKGFLIEGLTFLTYNGKQLGYVPSKTLIIRRGDLTKGIREEALRRGVRIEYKKKLVKIEQHTDTTATAHFEDGTSAHGRALIAADGIHSTTRGLLFADAPQPKYTGVVGTGGFAKKVGLPPSPVEYMIFGKKAFFSYAVAPSGEVYWFNDFGIKQEPKKEDLAAISNSELHRRLLEMHSVDIPEITKILQANETPVRIYPVYDLQHLHGWHKGSVCLIGDAAHAASPSAGQGASLAMEDAMMLAKCLRDISDIKTAFHTFEALRRPRAERIIKQSRRNGVPKSPTNAITRWFLYQLLPFFLRSGKDASEWMYSYRIEWDDKVLPVKIQSHE